MLTSTLISLGGVLTYLQRRKIFNDNIPHKILGAHTWTQGGRKQVGNKVLHQRRGVQCRSQFEGGGSLTASSGYIYLTPPLGEKSEGLYRVHYDAEESLREGCPVHRNA